MKCSIIKNKKKFKKTRKNKKKILKGGSSKFDEICNFPILERIDLFQKLKNYITNKDTLPTIDPSLTDKLLVLDNYREKQKLYTLNDIKYKFKPKHGCLGINNNNKIINITNKSLSYFTILNYLITYDLPNILNAYNELITSSEYITIDEDIFLFIDLFFNASFHNLDDLYNLLYFYKKSKLSCKLAVIKTDNFFYNLSLKSLKKYFNLEYTYLEPNKNYLFKKMLCTRQYHWLQKEAKEFIDKEYIGGIIKEYKGKPFFDNVSIIKYIDKDNASTYDTFPISDKFNKFCKEKNITDLNQYKEDQDYKIYLINKAKKIIVSYWTAYSVNIYKHCADFTNKEIFIINGGNNNQTSINKEMNINDQFDKIGDNLYKTYCTTMKAYILDNIPNLDKAVEELEKYFI